MECREARGVKRAFTEAIRAAGRGNLDVGIRGGGGAKPTEQDQGRHYVSSTASVGAPVAALPRADEVLVSSRVKDLVAGSCLVFEDTGEHERKGLPDHWRLYRVVGGFA